MGKIPRNGNSWVENLEKYRVKKKSAEHRRQNSIREEDKRNQLTSKEREKREDLNKPRDKQGTCANNQGGETQTKYNIKKKNEQRNREYFSIPSA